jgi:hypothetical protein
MVKKWLIELDFIIIFIKFYNQQIWVIIKFKPQQKFKIKKMKCTQLFYYSILFNENREIFSGRCILYCACFIFTNISILKKPIMDISKMNS